MQTDFVMSCKDAAFQKDEGKPKCDCHDMLLDKVTNLENKIEQLVSAIAQSGKGHQPGHNYRKTSLVVRTKQHAALIVLMKSHL